MRRAVHYYVVIGFLTIVASAATIQTVVELRRGLKPTGSLYLHCDLKASHYLNFPHERIAPPP